MIIPIPTNKKRFVIHLRIRAHRTMELGIQAYDPRYPHTYYLRRKARFLNPSQQRDFELKFPVSSKKMELFLFDKNAVHDEHFSVISFKVVEMEPALVWASEAQHRFLKFAIEFAQKAGHTPTGFYDSQNQEFLFHYVASITDPLGKELITPARTHRLMPRVQISKRLFVGYSIPIRVAILAHEGCHWFLNTRSQITADVCGIKQYLDYGFPKIEAVYAMTKIFGSYPQLIGQAQLERTREVLDFIESYTHEKESIRYT
ncbi:hypothetical protein ACFO3O_17370 [Dokdonia ponticola]|uniref:IrrE N-terminal-like domain-containing protein n=1 Tax=Dokdonia ponticola TaxID=2041041 RepID=A0ABV9I0V2_9FLAO